MSETPVNPTPPKILFCYVTGLYNSPDWSGLRPFMEGMSLVQLVWAKWDDPESLKSAVAAIIQALADGMIVFVGAHSHGGWRGVDLANGVYGALPVGSIAVFLGLDMIPPISDGFECHPNPFVPPSVVEAKAFYGIFDPLNGKYFQIAPGDTRPISNEYVKIEHGDFPEFSRDWIALKINALLNPALPSPA